MTDIALVDAVRSSFLVTRCAACLSLAVICAQLQSMLLRSSKSSKTMTYQAVKSITRGVRKLSLSLSMKILLQPPKTSMKQSKKKKSMTRPYTMLIIKSSGHRRKRKRISL